MIVKKDLETVDHINTVKTESLQWCDYNSKITMWAVWYDVVWCGVVHLKLVWVSCVELNLV